jgi:hypothetical protein
MSHFTRSAYGRSVSGPRSELRISGKSLFEFGGQLARHCCLDWLAFQCHKLEISREVYVYITSDFQEF